MVKQIRQARIEWALLGVIAVVCAVLSFLQYRWTGELSRAEPAMLRAGLNDQVRRLVQSFNDEIRENCTSLLPAAKDIRQLGMVEAHRLRYAQWAGSHDRTLFARIAIAAPESGSLRLYDLGSDGRAAPADWPPQWTSLRDSMTARINGAGRPPGGSADSSLLQLPVFSDAGGPGTEMEWMIFQVDEERVAKLLPHFVAEYLNPLPDADYDVSVSRGGNGGVLFSTRADHAAVLNRADVTASILSQEAVQGGRGRGRGGRYHEEGHGSHWILAVRHKAGSLDIAVSRARTRNLVASLFLVGLLACTAWALVRYTARSRRLADMQFQFAAGVSHDLRTPLTAIRGAAFNLSEAVVNDPATVTQYGKIILRNAEELTSMIENVLAFSASLRSGAAERREAFAIGDIVEHAADVMAQEVEQAGCRIEVNVAPELPAVVGDPVALDLVFRNLIGNAVRHGAGGKWIGVSAARAGDNVEVRVCDHGPGVPEEEREKIFEPYYRGEQTRVGRIQGTGLGLSLVKRTVEGHHGAIEVQNSPGGGAEFTVRLPAAPAA